MFWKSLVSYSKTFLNNSMWMMFHGNFLIHSINVPSKCWSTNWPIFPNINPRIFLQCTIYFILYYLFYFIPLLQIFWAVYYCMFIVTNFKTLVSTKMVELWIIHHYKFFQCYYISLYTYFVHLNFARLY